MVMDTQREQFSRAQLDDIIALSGLTPDQVRGAYTVREVTCLALMATVGELVAFVLTAQAVLRDTPHTIPAAALLTRVYPLHHRDGSTTYFWPLLSTPPE